MIKNEKDDGVLYMDQAILLLEHIWIFLLIFFFNISLPRMPCSHGHTSVRGQCLPTQGCTCLAARALAWPGIRHTRIECGWTCYITCGLGNMDMLGKAYINLVNQWEGNCILPLTLWMDSSPPPFAYQGVYAIFYTCCCPHLLTVLGIFIVNNPPLRTLCSN